MTPLVAVIVIVLIGVLAANVVSRARAGVRSVRSHHRALDTLGHITTQRPVSGVVVRGLPDAPRQAHIKILTPTVEAPPTEAPAEEAEVDVEDEVHVPAPVLPRFVLTPAPPNDLWDTVAIRELVDGPEEPEAGGDLEVDDAEVDPADAGEVQVDDDEELDDGDPTNGDVDLAERDHRTNGSHTNGSHTNGSHTNGDQANGSHTNGDQATGEVVQVVHLGGADGVSADDDASRPDEPEPVTIELAASHRSRLGAHDAAPPHRRRPAATPAAPGWAPWRHRRSQQVVAAVVVVALGVIAVVVVLGRHHPTPAAAPLPHSPVATPTSSSTPPTTKAKARVAASPVTLISDVPGVAHYRLAGGARVTLKANSPCWVEIRKTNAEGQSLYTATMLAGATESVTAPAWVRLGRPTAVSVTVGGTLVSPPSTPGRPYDLLFD